MSKIRSEMLEAISKYRRNTSSCYAGFSKELTDIVFEVLGKSLGITDTDQELKQFINKPKEDDYP